MTRRTALKSIVCLVVLLGGVSTASAFEKAVIVNQSNLPVTFRLKWSNLPFESGTITLLPGAIREEIGPDGTQLSIRYNASPGGGFPVQQQFVIKTAQVALPNQAGYQSYFRNTGPLTVGLTAQ